MIPLLDAETHIIDYITASKKLKADLQEEDLFFILFDKLLTVLRQLEMTLKYDLYLLSFIQFSFLK